MGADVVYLVAGVAVALALVLPRALRQLAMSTPLVLLLLGLLIGLLPGTEAAALAPFAYRQAIEHLTEFTVLVALMGAGLALDRPLEWRSFGTWRSWGATWRLLGIAMPLTIGAVALVGWWMAGLAPGAALLLGAVLAPTDPVLASDVQVEGPTTTQHAREEIDESDEVRFALTSEAGLNDGLAFPFVYLAVFLSNRGPIAEWALRWLGWELLGKVLLGTLLGTVVGWVLARAAFRTRLPSLGLAEQREPLLALTAILLSYGVAEIAGGYGFLAVFACAVTLRSAERGHEYHALMHRFIQQLERLLTVSILLLLGVALSRGLLRELAWQDATTAALLILLIRPLAGAVALGLPLPGHQPRAGQGRMDRSERLATAFFGVRGVGSLYYLAYAAGLAELADAQQLWRIVTFTIMFSVVVHGVTATPVMRRLEERRRP